MSDISQGPGWWIASDGNWYPPELHPDARATADVAASPAVYEQAGSYEQTTTSPGWSESGPWESSLVDGARESGVRVVPHWATMAGAALETPPVVSNGVTGGSVPSAHPMTDRHWRARPGRSPLLAVLAVVVLVAAGVLGYSLISGQGQSLTGDSPHQVATLASAAARTAGSVHLVVHLQGSGQTATYVDDSAGNVGREVITASGGIEVTTLVVGGTAYVKANQAAMTRLFHVSDTVARQYRGRWLSFPSSAAGYKQVADAVTLVSLLKDVTPSPSATVLTHDELDGRSVVGVQGTLPGGLSGTLYVASTGSPLPIEERSKSAGTVTTALFSDWGEAVTFTPPPGAVAGSAVPALSGNS